MIGRIRHFLGSTGGAAAAEMALLLPLLTVLLFGGMEVGGFLWSEHQVIKSVRNGARFAGRQDFSNFVCDADNLGTADAAVRNLIRTGTVDGSVSPVIRTWTAADDGITILVGCQTGEDYSTSGIYADQSGSDTPAVESARFVQISVALPYPSLFEDLGYLNGQTISATAQSPVMGF